MTAFLGECRKKIFEIKMYYAGYISSFIMAFIIFYGFFLNHSDSVQSYLLNFLYWYLLSDIISEGAITTSEEKQTGTINQLLLKPISFLRILMYKNIFQWIFSFVQIIIILIITLNLIDFIKVINIYTIVSGLLFFISLFGIGLIIASLTLINAKISNFTNIISFIFLFSSGGVIDAVNFPKWLNIINNFQPLALIIKFNNLLLNKNTLSMDILLKLIVVSIVYYCFGVFLYSRIFKHAKKIGISNRY